MRCSSALVLGTLAVGQAAAANIRHADFHARRNVEKKRDMNSVNWADVAYDLSGVDWSSVFATQKATPTPSSAAASTPTAAKVQVEQAQVQATTTATPAYTPPASSSAQQAAATSEASNPLEQLGDEVIGLVTTGLSEVLSKLGVSSWTSGKNAVSNNGKMWFGDDSDWKISFINGAGHDVSLMCWVSKEAIGGTVIANQPYIATTIPQGKNTTISFAGGVGSACAPIYPDTTPSSWGGIYNTWFEVTFKDPTDQYSVGTFDVSYEPNMSGTAMTAVGSQCTSDATTCVFKCTNGADHCGDAGTYALSNCNAGNGGGADTAAMNGGCNTASSAEHIEVTFH